MIEINLKKKLHGANGEFVLDVASHIPAGEFVTLFGASGAGKTMLLRCLAGLTEADAGSIKINGAIWFSANHKLPVQQRRVGYMFQDYALFPNMTVRGNLEFALRNNAQRKRVDELLEMMELGELQTRKPQALSGGQQQRVALARALAAEPQLLLLDEPFSALDHDTKLRLQDELLTMQRRNGLTTVMVSHDVSEVYRLSQRVLILGQGRIIADGTPATVFGANQAYGELSFSGEVLAIDTAAVGYIVTLLIGTQIVRINTRAEDARQLKCGQRMTLPSQVFSPARSVC